MNFTLIARLGALAALAAATGVAVAAPAAPSAADLASAKVLATNHCAVCHTFGKDEPAGVGPNLFNIIGRKAGAAEGFAYSAGFKKALADQTWDAKLLDKWLTDTQAVAPGSGMTYSQDDAAKRKKLIRFLESLR
jgi:cytochrome c